MFDCRELTGVCTSFKTNPTNLKRHFCRKDTDVVIPPPENICTLLFDGQRFSWRFSVSRALNINIGHFIIHLLTCNWIKIFPKAMIFLKQKFHPLTQLFQPSSDKFTTFLCLRCMLNFGAFVWVWLMPPQAVFIKFYIEARLLYLFD